jgi:hypothetical protein
MSSLGNQFTAEGAMSLKHLSELTTESTSAAAAATTATATTKVAIIVEASSHASS